VSLPFRRDAGLIIVPTRLRGPSGRSIARLALDTGATATVVSWDLVVALGNDPAIVSARIQITTGSGVEFAPRLRVQSIEALGQQRRGFPLLCHTLPPSATVDGVLGLDSFRGRRLVVDFRAGRVTVD
jgi:hypothetical protein